jgi:ribosomal protein S18 acetylase RimI-like enzyme
MDHRLAYRPVDAADAGFLLRVYGSTRAAELALTDWDATARDAFVQMQFRAQNAHYWREWPDAEHSIIQVLQATACQEVGRLWLHQRDDSLHVLDISLLPEWCGRGIGSTCLRALQDRAARQRRFLSIQVEQGNPARHLYERLGFLSVGEQQGIHQLMRWLPGPDAAATFQTEALSEQT